MLSNLHLIRPYSHINNEANRSKHLTPCYTATRSDSLFLGCLL